MQNWVRWWPRSGVGPWEALWRAVRGVYVGRVAETRARRWWSRRDRRIARASLRLIECRGRPDGLEPPVVWLDSHRRFVSLAQQQRDAATLAALAAFSRGSDGEYL